MSDLLLLRDSEKMIFVCACDRDCDQKLELEPVWRWKFQKQAFGHKYSVEFVNGRNLSHCMKMVAILYL